MNAFWLLLLLSAAPIVFGGLPAYAQEEAAPSQDGEEKPPCDPEASTVGEHACTEAEYADQISVDLNNFVSETLEIIDLARIKRETAPPPLTIVQQRQKDLVDDGYPFIPEGFLNAAKDGNEELLLRYLKADMKPNTTLTTGQTALHFAVLGDRMDIAQMLISYNANIDAQNTRGDAALHLAVERNKPYMVALLLSEGANPNLQNRDGWNALHLAAYNGFSEIVALLLKYDASINSKNDLGLTPLMLAIWKGHEMLARFLMTKGASLTPEDPQGNNAFMMAVSHNRINIVKLLLDQGTNPNTTNGRGWAALDIALESQFREIANMLYAAGADAPGLARTEGRILNAR